MIIDQLNLNQLRIFETVFRTGSMTVAAKELHLTQSGVSQHMKSLEDVLGVKLFDRVNQRLVPTSLGDELFNRCSKSLHEIETTLSELKSSTGELSGLVRVGMPVEFGNNVVAPRIAEFCNHYPQVSARFTLDYASAMNDQLLKGDLDFAFVDDFPMDKKIEVERVFDEILDLCIMPGSLKAVERKLGTRQTKAFFEEIDFIAYQPDQPVLRSWFAHHLGAKNIRLKVRATVMDVQANAEIISSGLGAGILPHHRVEMLLKRGVKLHQFKGCGRPLKNTISLAYLKDRTHTPAVKTALEYIRESIGKAGKGSAK